MTKYNTLTIEEATYNNSLIVYVGRHINYNGFKGILK